MASQKCGAEAEKTQQRDVHHHVQSLHPGMRRENQAGLPVAGLLRARHVQPRYRQRQCRQQRTAQETRQYRGPALRFKIDALNTLRRVTSFACEPIASAAPASTISIRIKQT